MNGTIKYRELVNMTGLSTYIVRDWRKSGRARLAEKGKYKVDQLLIDTLTERLDLKAKPKKGRQAKIKRVANRKTTSVLIERFEKLKASQTQTITVTPAMTSSAASDTASERVMSDPVLHESDMEGFNNRLGYFAVDMQKLKTGMGKFVTITDGIIDAGFKSEQRIEELEKRLASGSDNRGDIPGTISMELFAEILKKILQ